ncbi:MAG: response regulator [Candidatus Omnitrophica bacterium]|nr:response regulator [Candidatus Omnitrophota bacterium]MDD5436156.1 response regulator [Candidatus Omnitrophota bacterium]
MAKFKVLLVDDELDFQKIMGVHIKGWGYDLITASNGKEALAAVKDEKPDLVILDYVMPDMDGIKALRLIRQIDAKLPVIMFTANPDIKSIKGSKKLGVCAYVPKFCLYTNMPSQLKEELEKIRKAR